MLDAVNAIVEFINTCVDAFGALLSFFPMITQLAFRCIFPFLTYSNLLPVYFYPFIAFVAGGSLLLLILGRSNNRG